jgi:protein-S-isoprenylcysteine O-methyltransferase Ste14
MRVESRTRERWGPPLFERRSHFGGILVGAFLIIIGFLFLFQQFVPFISEIFWPLVLIFVGAAIILGGIKRYSREESTS